jgi:hypothetical protein
MVALSLGRRRPELQWPTMGTACHAALRGAKHDLVSRPCAEVAELARGREARSARELEPGAPGFVRQGRGRAADEERPAHAQPVRSEPTHQRHAAQRLVPLAPPPARRDEVGADRSVEGGKVMASTRSLQRRDSVGVGTRATGHISKITRDLGWVSWEDEDTPEDVQRFNAIGKNPMWWAIQSLNLNVAAELLMKHGPSMGKQQGMEGQPVSVLEPTALMLGGYAIENLLKALFVADHVAQNGSVVMSKRAVEFVVKSHDLHMLVTRTKLRTNKSDRDILKQLQKFVLWGGRYPIPLEADGYFLPAFFDRAIGSAPLWIRYVALYRKLYHLASRRLS